MATNEPIQDSETEQETNDDERPNDIKAETATAISDNDKPQTDGDGDDDDEDEENKGNQNENATTIKTPPNAEEDEDLEEGELKDDDDDDDEDDEELTNASVSSANPSSRLAGYHNSANNSNTNNNNNNNDNISGFSKESSFNDSRHHDPHAHYPNYPPPHHHGAGGGPPVPSHLFMHQPNSRRISPNADLDAQYPPLNHHQNFSSNSNNNNHYRYIPNDGPPLPPMSQHPQAAGGPVSPGMYPRGGPGGVGPTHRVRCRFYSKTSNKCTWGDHCRFEHRDDSPGPEFDGRPPPQVNTVQAGPARGPPMMGAAERGSYPQYPGRHQPYPPPPAHVYPYDHYGHNHSTPPSLPPHSMPHWRQQPHSSYPSVPPAHPPESVSPALLPTPGGGSGASGGSASRMHPTPPGSSSAGGPNATAVATPTAGPAGAPSPGYPSPSYSSSASPYERKHRLAYELAPWNDCRGYPPPPGSKYDYRGDPAAAYPPGPPGRMDYYGRNHYGREPLYGREPPPHVGGAYPGYPPHPSAYRGGSTGSHAFHYKYMRSSQKTVAPDTRRSRSTKRGHDEDESSWSDSGSEDSILGQANYSNKNHVSKSSKLQHQHHQQQQPPSDNINSDETPDQGSGTPTGEALPEDKERQEMLLNKLKEIEDLMAKKKGEQEDPV